MKAIEQNIEKEIAQAVMEEQPMQPPAPKRKKRLTESTAAKVIAFLLMLVMTAVTAGGVLGAVFLYSTDVYVTSETAFKQELFSNIAWGDGQTLLNFLIWNSEEQVYQMNTEAADSYCAERNISYVMVQDKTGRELWYTGLAEYDSPWQFRFSYDWANPERPSAGVVENAYTVRITVPLSSVFVYDDDYALANRLAELAYALRYWIYAIIAAAALLVTVCFIFLLCAAGHHPYVDGVRPGWGTRIPLDLLTAAVALGLFLGIQLVVEANFGGIGVVLAVVLGPAALAGVFTGWCMSLALRLKLGEEYSGLCGPPLAPPWRRGGPSGPGQRPPGRSAWAGGTASQRPPGGQDRAGVPGPLCPGGPWDPVQHVRLELGPAGAPVDL